MVTMDLEGRYHELLGAQTWDQSDLLPYSSAASYQLCHHGQVT